MSVNEHVTLRFRGLMLEKFISRALDSGVTFEAVKRLGRREARLLTDAEGARRLMKMAERFALDVSITQRGGPGALYKKAVNRLTLPLCVLVCAALSLMFLSRLWVIEINLIDGTSDKAPIVRALETLGIVPGTRMDDIEVKGLSLALMAEAGDFAYIGARKQGVRLLIEATRELPAPGVYNPKAARDLIASRDALLVSLDVMAGTAAVQPGQVVRQGQVLVRGEERDGRETTRGVCALGAATGRVWVTGEAEGSMTEEILTDTGRVRTRSEVRFMDHSLELTGAEAFELERVEVERLAIGGLVLPLHIVRTAHIEQRRDTRRASEDEVKAKITQIALEEALSKVPEGVSPVDKWIDYSMIEGENIRARAVVELKLNIAVARGAAGESASPISTY